MTFAYNAHCREEASTQRVPVSRGPIITKSSAQNIGLKFDTGIGLINVIDDRSDRECVAVEPSLTTLWCSSSATSLWARLCDGKLHVCSENSVLDCSIHAQILPKDETSIDLHAAEDKNGSSGLRVPQVQTLKHFPRTLQLLGFPSWVRRQACRLEDSSKSLW